MKNLQQGFIGIAIVIIAALAIGGVAYYHHKSTQEVKIQTDNMIVVDPTQQTNDDQKPAPVKKPVVLSFEAKARAAAQAGECGKYGTIGTALRQDEQNEYVLFTIDSGSKTVGSCAVDMYQRTTVEAIIISACVPGQENCHSTGALPPPRKVYANIPVAPLPSSTQ